MSSGLVSVSWPAAIREELRPGQLHLLQVAQRELETQSRYQTIALVESVTFGRGLILDDVPQFWEQDEHIYHEHLAALPLLFHAQPQRVLILGGGDGLALREVLADQRVEHVTLIDIDDTVVNLCRERYADIHERSFEDPRVTLILADALVALRQLSTPFDLVIVDLVDAVGPGWALYEQCLQLLEPLLNRHALIMAHGDATGLHNTLYRLTAHMQSRYAAVGVTRAFLPSFACEWGFILAGVDSAALSIDAELLCERAQYRQRPLRSLQPTWYPALLTLPPMLQDTVAQYQEDASLAL